MDTIPIGAGAGAPPVHTSAEACAEAIIARIGKDVRLALPLGLGKSTRLVNALYDMAKAEPSIQLTIYTALTLLRPQLAEGLENRFGEPVVERLFGDYPELTYGRDRTRGALPANVTVEEFFLATGTLLGNEYAQRHYNSVNYTHVLRRIIAADVNVIGQMVALRGDRVSLSCNTDISLDLIPLMREKAGRSGVIVVGEINDRLPFMPNDAELSSSEFDMLLDAGQYELAGIPAARVDLASHAIGLRAARLVKDGGTLQIGIGSLGDGAAQSIRLRHISPDVFRAAAGALPGPAGPVEEGGDTPFTAGLYGCTEMFTQGMFELLLAGIFKRPAGGGRDVTIDAGFYLGPPGFYDGLRNAPDDIVARINMTRVADVNALYGNEHARRHERVHARFINVAMKATCLGAVSSDALEDGRVVSGVGGQYNFVAQAHELECGRSIILLKAVRTSKGHPESNIVWSHGNTTIPRHLRDIVITEYGVADLREQTDEECVQRMLAITDARFIDGLVEQAIAAKKLPRNFAVPEAWRRNAPDAVRQALAPYQESLPSFPFDTELSETEQELGRALTHLKSNTSQYFSGAMFTLGALFSRDKVSARRYDPHLERVSLKAPRTLKDRVMNRLLLRSLRETSDSGNV